MASMDTMLSSLTKSIKQASEPKTKAYDTVATVTRVEDGVAWVHIPGGVEETPVKMTVAAKPGQTVQVRVSGGRAFLVGNATAPPTDDTEAFKAKAAANNAYAYADKARQSAESAEASASAANEAATQAIQDASDAARAAGDAQTSANAAQASANNANEYAARALGNLSTVQSVAETLNWITAHGTMTLTTDTALDPTHVYFVQDAGGDYVVGGVHYSVVKEPVLADIGTYYELGIDESLNNYVATHLALTDDGLYVINDNRAYKILLSANGMMVYDAQGNLVSTFGESVVFSSSRRQYIGGNDAYIEFDPATGAITIGGTKVTIGGTKKVQDLITAEDVDPVYQTVADLAEKTDDTINEINEEIHGDGTDENTGIIGALERNAKNIEDLSDEHLALSNNVNGFMSFGTEGGIPTLTLGADGSDFLSKFTNEQLQFLYQGTVLAYLTGAALHVSEQLSFGNFILYQRSNGHFTIKYTGGAA